MRPVTFSMESGKSAHSIYKTRYYPVTAAKYRKVLLISKVEERIKETLKGISERYEMAIDGIGF